MAGSKAALKAYHWVGLSVGHWAAHSVDPMAGTKAALKAYRWVGLSVGH